MLIVTLLLAFWFAAKTQVALRRFDNFNWLLFLLIMLFAGALIAIMLLGNIRYRLDPYLFAQGVPMPVKFIAWHTDHWADDAPSTVYSICSMGINIALTWVVLLGIFRFFAQRQINKQTQLSGARLQLM